MVECKVEHEKSNSVEYRRSLKPQLTDIAILQLIASIHELNSFCKSPIRSLLVRIFISTWAQSKRKSRVGQKKSCTSNLMWTGQMHLLLQQVSHCFG